MDFLVANWLDIVTTLLGLLYIALEYRASIALWVVGVIMPALDIYLYYSHGLYGDAAMAVYYTVAAVYGYAVWKFGRKGGQRQGGVLPITRFPKKRIVPAAIFFMAAMGITYYILANHTNSTVPLLDSLTNALSFVALWALARKYIEQWFLWIAVDIISCYLYITKGIPFKAGLYGLYVVIAVMGYCKWKAMMGAQETDNTGKPAYPKAESL